MGILGPDINFKHFTVTPLGLDSVQFEWDLYLSTANISGYKFRILKTAGAAGPFDNVVDNLPINVRSYRDDSSVWHSKIDRRQWRAEIYDPSNGNILAVSQFNGICYDQYDSTTLNILRKLKLILENPNKGIGVECWHLAYRTWGERCPNCWDPLKMKMKISNCPVCYATSFKDGYFAPVKIWLNMGPWGGGARVLDMGQQTEQYTVPAFTMPAPYITINDLIIDAKTNDRFRVISWESTNKRNVVLRQKIKLQYLSKNNIEQRIPKP